MKQSLRHTARILSFSATSEELRGLGGRDLLVGLVCTWLVGMGRYWDDPRAEPWQRLGVGSLVYVGALSLLLFFAVWPLAPRVWRFAQVLSFVTLVSPPAALYAIPVERFLSLEEARTANGAFLACVAAWRVGLLWLLLRRYAGLSRVASAVAGALPLAAIVSALFALNLEHATYDLMGGFREPGPQDLAYQIVVSLTFAAFVAFWPLIAAYVVLVFLAHRRRRPLRGGGDRR